MSIYYVRLRFVAANGKVHPAIIHLEASGFRAAGAILEALVTGFEIGSPLSLKIDELSLNKPRGYASSFTLGGPVTDPGLQTFIGDNM